jgi:hypothetical protein
MFFHVLKNGCQVEALQLTSMARVERALQRVTAFAAGLKHARELRE